jgi:RimJ/RimL family protein N-acetyltransferase
VTTHACGLMLHYLLDPSGAPHECLGLRRAQWFANEANARSRTAAERLGFQFEGVLRFHRIVPEGKISAKGRNGESPDDGRGGARHSVLLGLCWDDWRNGGREKIVKLMER